MIKCFFLVFYALILVNSGSYAIYRSKKNGVAKLRLKRKVEDGGKMTYCLPGLKSDPEKAFKFQEKASIHEKNFIIGGITYVCYEDTGFNPKTIAEQIVNDIKTHNYEPIIISVSVGDQVARIVEQEVDNLKIVAINPATNIECLKCEVYTMLIVKQFFSSFFLTLIGWIAQLRLVKTDSKKNQSLILANDMKNYLIKSNLEVGKQATKGLILSRYDKMLDNNDVYDVFGRVTELKTVIVETAHANLSVGGILYRDKITDIFKSIYDTP